MPHLIVHGFAISLGGSGIDGQITIADLSRNPCA